MAVIIEQVKINWYSEPGNERKLSFSQKLIKILSLSFSNAEDFINYVTFECNKILI